tara:strand:+ start:375 stop:659 length:285 start_codon:yes stop_codon:yes gene_type:complete
MATVVEEYVEFAVAVSIEDNRFLSHPTQDIVSVLRDLTFMSDEKPRAWKYPFKLVLIDFVSCENVSANSAIVQVHELASIFPHPALPHLASPLR